MRGGLRILFIIMPAKKGIKPCRCARECIRFVDACMNYIRMYVTTQLQLYLGWLVRK